MPENFFEQTDQPHLRFPDNYNQFMFNMRSIFDVLIRDIIAYFVPQEPHSQTVVNVCKLAFKPIYIHYYFIKMKLILEKC